VLGKPTSRAATVQAERQAAVDKREKTKADTQAAFEKDKSSLGPQELLKKYGQGDLLTDQQRAVLFKIRNPGRTG
jgi:hypothetical protein